MRLGPVGFLFATAIGWATLRALMLWPQGAARDAPRRIAWAPPIRSAGVQLASEPRDIDAPRSGSAAPVQISAGPDTKTGFAAASVPPITLPALPPPSPARPVSRPILNSIQPPERVVINLHPPSRFSVSAWAIVRGRAGAGLATAGQLGGSQAGVRARYDLGAGLAAAVRVSAPLRSRSGKEAAVALDWRPTHAIPIAFTVERRFGLDRGGRNAFAMGVFGGVDNIALPLRFRLDGYGQAGVVGFRNRDGYVDGALRAEHGIMRAGRVRFGAGMAVWGGVQPATARLDIGPQLVAHVPARQGGFRIGAEWRARVAGHAGPGSGAALTVGADF